MAERVYIADKATLDKVNNKIGESESQSDSDLFGKIYNIGNTIGEIVSPILDEGLKKINDTIGTESFTSLDQLISQKASYFELVDTSKSIYKSISSDNFNTDNYTTRFAHIQIGDFLFYIEKSSGYKIYKRDISKTGSISTITETTINPNGETVDFISVAPANTDKYFYICNTYYANDTVHTKVYKYAVETKQAREIFSKSESSNQIVRKVLIAADETEDYIYFLSDDSYYDDTYVQKYKISTTSKEKKYTVGDTGIWINSLLQTFYNFDTKKIILIRSYYLTEIDTLNLTAKTVLNLPISESTSTNGALYQYFSVSTSRYTVSKGLLFIATKKYNETNDIVWIVVDLKNYRYYRIDTKTISSSQISEYQLGLNSTGDFIDTKMGISLIPLLYLKKGENIYTDGNLLNLKNGVVPNIEYKVNILEDGIYGLLKGNFLRID